MGKRIDVLPLEELYERKMTPAILKHVIAKENFTSISKVYCEKACVLSPSEKENCGKHKISDEKVDVLLVLPNPAPRDRYREGAKLDEGYLKVINYLVKEYFDPVKVSFAVTYAMRCRPTEEKTAVTALRRCTPYLAQEVAQRAPRIVLGLGVDVGKSLGLKKASRGLVASLNAFGHTFHLLTTIHPKILTMIRQNASGQFWGPDYLDLLRRDFKKAADVASGRVALLPVDRAIEVVKQRITVASSLEEIERFVKFVEKQSEKDPMLVSWDTETSGLDPWNEDARFLCHQFGYRAADGICESFVIPLWHKDNRAYRANDAWKLVVRVLENENVHKVTHNGAFDMIYTKVSTGVDVKSVKFDTMLLLHSQNSGMQGQYDLKTSTADLLFEMQLGGYEDLLAVPEEDEEEEE